MEKFINFRSKPTPLNSANVDTDQIIPKQFLKRIERTGFGQFLFFDWRFHDDGSENPDFVLNMPEYKNSSILLAQDNFGCGSSREHAPWALRDYGFKVIISTSFADIFYNNCFKNGILPIQISEKVIKEISESALRGNEVQVVLSKQIILYEDNEINFDIDPSNKNFLMQGLDDIGLTLKDSDIIDSYEQDAEENLPWYSF